MAADTNTLEAAGLLKSYGGKRVVDRVDIALKRREIVGLLGPNGAGKTTTFYMVVGLTHPDQGRVFLDGMDITADPMYRRARRGISYLAQEPSVFRKLTVEQNLLAILELLNIQAQERKSRLEKALNELGIAHLAKQKAISLSGGERRRLEISRALVTDPRFMLLDEPFAGIDPMAINDIQQIIRHLKERGLGIVISDHNVRETLSVCDNAYIISQGRIIEQGPPHRVVNSETVRSAYLGENFNL
ncbi:MAG: LPS export ABC transporter ATP-binding protein [Deltaproteobacteria bacterium]|nr:LPS export ABC transporter ATP-binding protein [Deltaproteobacteria bacterium]MCF8118628.1 LPS export ABC transporter ATP-binding protein [Deltaproteobacteria bacterium]